MKLWPDSHLLIYYFLNPNLSPSLVVLFQDVDVKLMAVYFLFETNKDVRFLATGFARTRYVDFTLLLRYLYDWKFMSNLLPLGT